MAELNWGHFCPLVHYRGITDPVQNKVKAFQGYVRHSLQSTVESSG